MIYVFGNYELDTQLYELRHAGRPRKLEPQAFNVLAYLIAHRSRVVTKQELLDRLWPNHSVSESTLTQRLRAVRKAVGDDGRTQRTIQTVHGRGYRFIAPLEEYDHGAPTALRRAVPEVPTSVASQTHAFPSALAGECKLVTVLCGVLANAATVVEQHGFEALRCACEAFFALAQHVVQHYTGHIQPWGDDGFLALFGVPVAQEDHAFRAVLAAAEIQQRLQERHKDHDAWQHGACAGRFGLHTDLVMVDKSRDEALRSATVTGEATALAIQLQYLAQPGMLLASEATIHLVQDVVGGEAWKEVYVPGQARPVMAYTIQACDPRRVPQVWQRRGPLSQFVGRAYELATLHTLLAQAADGQGQVVGIVGEPGMGKSRLLYEFRHSLAPQRVTVLEGHCLSYGDATPYVPVLDLVRQHCGLIETDDVETITAKVVHRLYEAEMDGQEEAVYLLRLLGVSEGTASLAKLSLQAVKDRTFATLRRLFLQSTQQPLMVIVENLHWIDATSEEWLTSLVTHLTGASLLLLTTYRPGYRPPWIDKSYATQVSLSRLVPRDGLSVVQSVPRAERLTEVVVQEIVLKAGGNPFFLEELTWSAVEHGDLQTPLLIPNTIQAVLAARIDRLPPVAKHLLQIAAVIGKDMVFALLQAVAEWPEQELSQALLHLQTVEFLYESRGGMVRTYSFKHALTRDAAYQSLLVSTRKQLHQRIAGILLEHFPETARTQPELLAHHYTAAGCLEQAIDYWQRAGQRALGRSALVEAVAHYTKGLELLMTMPETLERTLQELRLQTALGPVLMTVKGFASPEVEHTYTRARELCQQVGETPQLFPVLFGLVRWYTFRQAFQTARKLGEQCLSLVQQRHDPGDRIEAHWVLGIVLFYLGEFDAARELLEQGSALYDPQQHRAHAFLYGQDPGVACQGFACWTLWTLGYPERALQRSREALRLAQELTHPHSLAFALNVAAWLHNMLHAWQTAQEHAEVLMTHSQVQGFPLWAATGKMHAGMALVMQGHSEAGITQMRQGLAAWQATGAGGWAGWLVYLAEACGHIGQIDEGLRLLDQALVVVETTSERYAEAEIYRLKGEFLLAQGSRQQQAQSAEASFHQALVIAQRQHAKALELRAALGLSRLWQQQNRRNEARQLLAEIYGWFSEGFDTGDLQTAQMLLAKLK